MDELSPIALPSHQRTAYLSLQQEADFALWRAREASLEVRQAYARHASGDGPAPSEAQLAQLVDCERDAEAKYKALRNFLRALVGAT